MKGNLCNSFKSQEDAPAVWLRWKFSENAVNCFQKTASPCTWDTRRKRPRADSASQRSRLTPWPPSKPERERRNKQSSVFGVWFFCGIQVRRWALTATIPTVAVRQVHATPTTSKIVLLGAGMAKSDVVIRTYRHNYNTHNSNTPWMMESLQRSFHPSPLKVTILQEPNTNSASDECSAHHHRVSRVTMETGVFLNSDLPELTHMKALTAVTCMNVRRLMMSSRGSLYRVKNTGPWQLPWSSSHGPQTHVLLD